MPSFTALSPEFNAYHVLNTIVYLASNNLFNNYSDSGKQKCMQLLDMLVYQIPPKIARTVLSANYLSIRAAWENAFGMARCLDHSDAVVFLVEMILDANSNWAEGMMNTMLLAIASCGNTRLLRRLIQKGARPSNAQKNPSRPFVETAIVLAAKSGAWDCMQLMLDPEVCDPNASVSLNLDYAPSRPVSNFLCFFIFIEWQLSRAWRVDPEDGLYFWSDHIWTEDLGFYTEGLNLFLRAGADVDLPYSWYRTGWSEPSLLTAFHDRANTPREWHPTILDVSLYLDNRLFQCLEPHSRTHFATDRVTRSGLCKSALEGHHALNEYLQSRPPPPAHFMELILAEQFFMRLLKPQSIIVKVNARLGRAMIEYGIDIDSAAVRQCGGVAILLEFLVASAGAFGLDEDTSFILEYLLQKGAYIGPEALLLGVQPKGVRILETLVQHGADIERDGRYALAAAAFLDNHEAVDWLLQRRVDINSEFSSPRPLTLIGAALLGFPNSDPGVLDIFATRLARHERMSLEMIQHLLDKGAGMKLHISDSSPYNFITCAYMTTSDIIALMSQNPAEMAKISDLDWLSLSNGLLIGRRIQFGVLEIFNSQHRNFDSGAFLAATIQGIASHNCIEGLLETASDIELYSSAHDRLKLTPLQAAAWNCDRPLVLRLLDRGANINAPAHEDGGETVLTALLERGIASAEEMRQRHDLLHLLIAKGADLALVGPQGWGPLHACAMEGDLENTLLLLEHGADPTTIGTTRLHVLCGLTFYTALDAAVYRRRLDITHVLLKAGSLSARPGTTGYEGALRMAEENDSFVIAQVIRDHVVTMTKELNSHPELLRQHEERMQQQVSRLAEAESRWEDAARRWKDQNSGFSSQDEDLTGDTGDAEGTEDGDGGEPEIGDEHDMSQFREIEAGDQWEQPYSAHIGLDGLGNDGPYQGENVPDYGPMPPLFTFEMFELERAG